MTNNLSGIVYRLWAVAGFLFLDGVIIFAISRVWNPEKRDVKGIVVGFCLTVLALALGARYTIVAMNPRIETYEGNFCEVYRDSRVAPPLPFTSCYVFSNKMGSKMGFYLDTFSKKSIWPQEFQDNDTYRIYYESSTRIIVKVELAEKYGDVCWKECSSTGDGLLHPLKSEA